MAKQKLTGNYQQQTSNWILYIGLSGALAVALGAFGAHALEGKLSAERLEIFETASFYHFAHTLLLLGVYLLGNTNGWSSKLYWSSKLLGAGLFVFCGSLYVLATRGLIVAESASWLGAITPLGGAAFIVAWILLALSYKNSKV